MPNNAFQPTYLPLLRVVESAAEGRRYVPDMVPVNPPGMPATLRCGSGVHGLTLKSTKPHARHGQRPRQSALCRGRTS